ncbi:MAG TPA: TonB-dependent receptor [Kofleriaceae bacterium]|nr:TonB-dependent receptor [Kofleriaceae bacterium]
MVVQEAEPEPPAAATGIVHGVVRDKETGRPLPGVSVYLAETGAVAITDEAGRFEHAGVAAGPTTVVAIDPSYRKGTARVTVPASGPAPALDIPLVPLNLRADEILVEVERQRQAAGETVMRREEITRVPGARGDMLQAVQSLPGIAKVEQIGPQEGLVIRGSSPADSRIFVDGFEIPILYHFGGIQSVIPSEMIDSLTYTPGGFGVEYGKASAGVIDVRTRSGSKDYSGFGEVSFINTAGLAQGPLGKKGNFTAGVRRSYIDAVIPLVVSEDDLSFTTLPVYYDYQARAEYRPSSHLTLSTFFFGTDDQLELATTEVDPEDPEGKASGRFYNHTRFTFLIGSAAYERGPIKNRLSLLAGTQLESFEIGTDRYLRLEEQKLGARNEGRAQLSDELAIIAGGEVHYFRDDNKVRIPRPPKEGDPSDPNLIDDPLITTESEFTFVDAAGWSALELTPASWLKATAGVRTDWFGRNDALVVQPRGQVRTQVAPATALLGSVGLYTRPPDSNDENIQTTDIEPERAIQYSLGLEQKLGRGLELTTTGFYMDRSKLIVFAQGDRTDQMENDGSGTYSNEGEGRTYGAEALLRLRSDAFFGWIAYTLSRSERRDHPMDAERLFDHDQTHNVVLVASYKLGRWQLGGRFQYTTGSPYTPVTGATFMSDANEYQPTYGAINSKRNPANHQLDLRVDRFFQFDGWKLAAYLDVSNVYMNAPVVDRDYSYDYTEREETTGLPILPSIGIRGEF